MNESFVPIDITPTQDGGVLKKIKREGLGDLKPSGGSQVKVHYVGTLQNGEKFDSSRDRNTEFEFTLGRSQVIKGWDIGVSTMLPGEIAEFTIRSDYGYGDTGSPPKIPGGATLIFEVELLTWQAEDISPDKDGSITRTIIVEGEKLANPNETSVVVAHAVGSFEGRVFFDKELEFPLGEGSEYGLPEGVDRALRRFCRGEKSNIKLKGTRFTYGKTAPAEYNLPPNASIEFTLFLRSYEKVPHTWEMSSEEKLAAAEAAKMRGTQFLQQNKLRLAFNKYKRVEELLEYEKSSDPEQIQARHNLILAAYLNLALTCAKMEEYIDSIRFCDKALEVEPNNVKALYRKATARFATSDIQEAREMFTKIVELDPENKAAAQQILVCKQTLKEQAEKEKKRFKNLFAKIADENSKLEAPEVNPFTHPVTTEDIVAEDQDDVQPSTSTATA